MLFYKLLWHTTKWRYCLWIQERFTERLELPLSMERKERIRKWMQNCNKNKLLSRIWMTNSLLQTKMQKSIAKKKL